MDLTLRPPQLDELGLPLGWDQGNATGEPSAEMLQDLMSGNFASLGLPPPDSMPTSTEVRKEARERSGDILSQWRTLQQILERHEEVIRKRWMKKTKSARAKILTACWPNMAVLHRPDFEAWRREGSRLRDNRAQFREAYMWPNINLEDLSKGKTMLIFLNSRGRYPPRFFARADHEATRLGRVAGQLMGAFLNMYTMFLDGDDIESYGRLVSWDDDDDAMMQCFSRMAYQPGEGLMILEIQQKILRFLVDCSKSILHDIPSNALNETEVRPEPPPLADSSEWSSLASVTAESPYRLPSRVDFNRLRSLVIAKRLDLEDHIQALREDPAYFADVLADWSSHRQETMLDTNGSRHPVRDKPLFWGRVIGNIISDAYGGLTAWEMLSVHLEELEALRTKYSKDISPDRPLPPEYMKALLAFRYTLGQVQKSSIAFLKTGVPASPHYRSYFARSPAVPGSNIISLVGKGAPDLLMVLFGFLWDDQKLGQIGLPGLIDEIEKIIENDPHEKAKISSWVAGVFSELGFIARLQHELEIYLPWAASFEHEYVTYKEEIEKDFPRRAAVLAKTFHNMQGAPFSKFGDPSDGRFRYPSDKRRTKQTTNVMREAENNLDIFWTNVDMHCKRKCGEFLGDMVRNITTGTRALERTPEWVEPTVRIISNPPGSPRAATEGSSSQRQFNIQETVTKFKPMTPKLKEKTRGSSKDQTTISQDEDVSEEVQDDQPTFRVKARVYKVFKALFFNPSQPDLPGEVPWTDFLFAMNETGFAPQKLYGSVWQFTPSKTDVERNILFHEPHPASKIPFRNARRMGRRLNRTYGWHGGMFVLE
ncbi:hypothetical protein B0J14DRAFT_608129 [Halenospora varia]|nr:hypothetical protein B0J14DRAFT_608129 [Halenospora varia]